MKYLILVLVLALIITPFYSVSAQVSSNLGNSGVVIELSPKYPEPNSVFKASINDYSITAQISSIKWRVNGEVVPNADNLRTISIEAPAVGRTANIEAAIVFSTGGNQVIKKSFTPVYLDVVAEPQTKTPAFYRGRALPSVGSTVNLTAVVSGSGISTSNLFYTWQVNNKVINGGSIIGNNKSSIVMPPGQQALVTVSIQSADGSFSIRKSLEIASVSPKLYFYELNSLYGLSQRPFTSLGLIGNSVTVRAEPYYLDVNTYNNPDHLEWKIDGAVNQSKSANPYEMTVARIDDYTSGISRASLHIRNMTQLLQGVEGGFQINF